MCRNNLPFVEHFTFAKKNQADVRQLHEVSACSDRTVCGNTGRNLFVEKRGEKKRKVSIDAGVPCEERCEAHGHDGAHVFLRKILSHTKRVASDKIFLKILARGFGNRMLLHGAETSRKAVYGLTRGARGEKGSVCLEILECFRANRYGGAASDCFNIFHGEFLGAEFYCGHCDILLLRGDILNSVNYYILAYILL